MRDIRKPKSAQGEEWSAIPAATFDQTRGSLDSGRHFRGRAGGASSRHGGRSQSRRDVHLGGVRRQAVCGDSHFLPGAQQPHPTLPSGTAGGPTLRRDRVGDPSARPVSGAAGDSGHVLSLSDSLRGGACRAGRRRSAGSGSRTHHLFADGPGVFPAGAVFAAVAALHLDGVGGEKWVVGRFRQQRLSGSLCRAECGVPPGNPAPVGGADIHPAQKLADAGSSFFRRGGGSLCVWDWLTGRSGRNCCGRGAGGEWMCREIRSACWRCSARRSLFARVGSGVFFPD